MTSGLEVLSHFQLGMTRMGLGVKEYWIYKEWALCTCIMLLRKVNAHSEPLVKHVNMLKVKDIFLEVVHDTLAQIYEINFLFFSQIDV